MGGIKLMDIDKNTSIIQYSKTDNVLNDICSIIDSARDYAFQSVNLALVERNWLIGYRIAEEELKGQDRANYGVEVIKNLSKELTKEYGKGFDRSNLYRFLNFYKNFPEIVDAVSRQSRELLSWTHYRTLLQVLDKEAREWYEKEALSQTWSVRTLQRNISTQYYYRLLKSQEKEPVIEEMKEKNKNNYLVNKLEFIKNPVIAEFLGYSLDDSFTETELESSIINNLQKFLMELRKRICFCCKTTTYSY
jgi:predicted nuclease of restriction endonuclease-like (RecB) superfamily